MHDQPKLISATLDAVTLIVLSGGLLIQAKKAEKPENKTKDDKKLKAENKTKAEEKMKDAKATKADVAEDTKATDRQTQQPKKKSLLGLLRFLLTTEHISLGIAISASMCLLACLKNHLSNK